MRPRYLLLTAHVSEGWTAKVDEIAASTGLAAKMVRPGLAVLANHFCHCLTAGEGGVVVGTLFPRHGLARPVERLEPSDAEAIAASAGRRLLDLYWGGYVAAIEVAGALRIQRDPSAALPCYLATRDGITAFASDADLLVEAGLAEVDIDWATLGRLCFNAGVPVPETAIAGISELLPGFAINGSDPALQEPCWSPWDHVGERAGAQDEVADRVERAVMQCVTGWCSGRGRLLLSLSGGLDSSIVAACLAGAGLDTMCLTIYGEDAAGDERTYARVLSDHLALPLVERADCLEAIDVAAALDPHLPRPVGRTQALSYERIHIAVAGEIAADAYVTGNGGDSVFGYSQSAAAIADRFLSRGIDSALFGTLRDVVSQTGCGAWQAAKSAIRIARGPRAYRCRPDRAYLHPELLAALDDRSPRHPWLEAPSDALPGKAAHIASILRVQHCLEPGRSRMLPVINPLMSQPIIESCLAIPSWMWREGGRDRAVARSAFSRRLPDMITKRRVKGGPDGFAARILERYRSEIGERLLEGQLARHRIVDVEAIHAVLKDERPILGEERVRLFTLLAAEAWVDSWTARARASVVTSRQAQRAALGNASARSLSQWTSSP